MSSARERRQADLFFADLMGSRPQSSSWRGRGPAAESGPGLSEDDLDWKDLKSGRVVFYDEDTLQFIEGWTRADKRDRVVVLNRRSTFDPIRDEGRERSRAFDDYLRRKWFGAQDLQAPVFVFHKGLHTGPLRRGAAGDWDDRMIDQLIAAGRPVSIQSEKDQWVEIRSQFERARQDARDAAIAGRPALEFVDFFVLDTSPATLGMVRATNVTMIGNHADIPMARTRTGGFPVLPGGAATQRVIGDIHTHVLLDRFIDLSSTATGTTVRDSVRTLHNGVSPIDVAAARRDRFVVFAIDSRWLHRANPDGSKEDKLPQSGNLLREALRIFGGEPL